jgi:hypothetical protein
LHPVRSVGRKSIPNHAREIANDGLSDVGVGECVSRAKTNRGETELLFRCRTDVNIELNDLYNASQRLGALAQPAMEKMRFADALALIEKADVLHRHGEGVLRDVDCLAKSVLDVTFLQHQERVHIRFVSGKVRVVQR